MVSTRLELQANEKDPKRVNAGKQGGRPYKGGKERTSLIQIKVTPEEHELVTKSARAAGQGISDLFRQMLLVPVSEEDKSIALVLDNRPTFLSKEQAKDLYRQLSNILIGASK